jgi:hypothetical protein
VPTTFKTRSTDITDRLIDPNLLVQVDVSTLVSITDSDVMVNKVSMSDLDQGQIDFINANILGNNITYGELISTLISGNIPYDSRESRVPINNPNSGSYGYFNVLDYYKKDINIITNDNAISQNRLVYQLDTLTYTRDGSDAVLKSGDVLFLNNQDGSKPNTDFTVEFVNTSTNEIAIKLRNGGKSPRRGFQVFGISPASNQSFGIDVPIRPNGYAAIFIKPINQSTNTVNPDWGSATVFNTSTLRYTDDTDITLNDFYERFTNDAIKSIQIASELSDTPISQGLTPNVPDISVDNFRVVIVNDHKSGKDRTEGIRKQVARKETLKSQISSLDSSIRDDDRSLKTFNFRNNTEKDAINSRKQNNLQLRQSKVQELNSIVNDLVSRTRDSADFTPKYRIRGFWPIPSPRYLDQSEQLYPQHVVQFVYRYRYLRPDNSSSEGESFTYTNDEGEQVRASFTKWVEVRTKSRKKSYVNGKLVWLDEQDSDPDVNNINQLDIPITRDENVEIQVKSISEVGFPQSPLESDWSSSAIIQFPDEVEDIEFVSASAESDLSTLELINELSRVGLDQHLADSNEINEVYFSHSSDSIATNQRTPENKPVNLTTVLDDYKNKISSLEALISGQEGQIKISIVDESGELVSDVSNLDTVDIFSGYYVDEVSQSAVPKGEIISKLYFIRIENVNPADLELLSYVPGAYTDKLPSDPAYDGYLFNKYEYDNYRKYHEAPIALRDIIDNAEFYSHHQNNTGPFRQLPAYQSSQVKSQFAYCRSRDLSLNTRLYELPVNIGNQVLTINEAGSSSAYVWDESFTGTGDSPSGNGNLSDFCVHVDHPYLQAGSYFMDNFGSLYNTNKVPDINLDAGSSNVVYPAFYHSRYFNLQATEVDGLKQLAYYQYTKGTPGDTFTFANHPRKVGFINEDKYLIGKNTCGSYLFMTVNPKNINTLSPIYNQGFSLKNGNSFTINVPFTFQYRMTDYNGDGSSGTGTIGGFGAGQLSNLTYTKKIGLDILIKGGELFSFDIQCTAKYKPSNLADTKKLIR